MSAYFSFSYFCSTYFYLHVVLSLFHLCFSNNNFDDVLCMDDERQTLVEFKHGLIDETDRLASWNVGEERDCCRWVGIACDNSTGHISRIHLRALDGYCDESYYDSDKEYEEASKQRLRGNLSSSLLHLKQLRHLDLSCNDFGGIQIPKFIGSLKNLRHLNLSRSNFGGIAPPQLGNLSELQVLCLGSFHMPYETRSMMNMQWLSSLRMLHHLDMSGVDLTEATDWLQVINTIPFLVQLHLSSTSLTKIHPHVTSVNLTYLSLLDLSQNKINSSFPRWIFSITSLVSLDLSDCSFHSLIPSDIYSFRKLSSLESLDVGGNNFMNSSLVLRDLSSVGGNLISLDISYCGISSSVLDSLHNLTSLLSLDLSGNQLTKRIPKSVGYNLCNMRDLDFSFNDFFNVSLTSLLESIFKCKSAHLESLILWSSGLSGTIPDSIGRLSFLRSLDLGGNQIFGPVSFSIGLLSLLTKLNLSYNQLNGVLPNSIGRLSLLEVLDLSYNRISGTIPDSIGRLSSLEVLYLSNNQLNGSLPNSLGQLSKLETFGFSSNLLTGVVTEAYFSKLVSLKYLDGGGNNLTLSRRLLNWIPPFQLLGLNLNSWGLGPQFPMWLQSQKDLVELEISNTGISSPIPSESFWRSLPNLDLLILSFNKLKGELTPISNFSLPSILDLSNNLFVGSLNDFLCSDGMKETTALYLGNNQLSGVIPECWDKWPQLSSLNLENNNLSGWIPTTLGSLYNVLSLDMHGNKLSGQLPASLMNLTRLQILQLGGNELVGSIPSWFGTKLSDMRLLNLRSNSFDGNIPRELCYLKYIQILELADNNLSGNIPRCFNNWTVLSGKETTPRNPFMYSRGYVTKPITDSLVMKGQEYTYSTILPLVMLLDLSSNNISGNIPSELTLLLKLQTLNLSRNHLTERIPENIGNMKSLETFDLSMNKLSGELPTSLSRLNSLSSFNVSFNNLTGKVPSSTQLQSFNESSFFGNKLCGPPLIEHCGVVVEVPADTDTYTDTEDQQEHNRANWGLIISVVLGFVSGFWIVLAPLIASRSWRITYYRFMNELGCMVYDLMHKYCFNMLSK